MRRSNQDKQLILDNNGDLIAVCLGFDFCCEHECGMSKFYAALGIKGPTWRKQGIKARQITTVPVLFSKTYGKKDHVLIWNEYLGRKDSWFKPEESYEDIPSELKAVEWKGAKEEDLKWSAAWCSGPGTPSFGLRFRGDTKILDQLREAFAKKDIALLQSATGFGGRGGLVIAVASRVPKETDAMMREADLDNLKLQVAAAKTKIKAKVDARAKEDRAKNGYGKGIGYYALSPGWKMQSRVSHGPIETKHPVMFFLNPMDQENNNFGWFTVEELEQWLEGKGPIPGGRKSRR